MRRAAVSSNISSNLLSGCGWLSGPTLEATRSSQPACAHTAQGLRGAIAFSLALLLTKDDSFEHADQLVATTLVIAMFTTIFQVGYLVLVQPRPKLKHLFLLLAGGCPCP